MPHKNEFVFEGQVMRDPRELTGDRDGKHLGVMVDVAQMGSTLGFFLPGRIQPPAKGDQVVITGHIEADGRKNKLKVDQCLVGAGKKGAA